MRWKCQFVQSHNLIAYSNQLDELIRNIYMAWSNFAISGGENPTIWSKWPLLTKKFRLQIGLFIAFTLTTVYKLRFVFQFEILFKVTYRVEISPFVHVECLMH